jgi:two-component system response regulator MtrA
MPNPIVVVDDEPDLLKTLCLALELEGFEVLCFAHPAKVASSLARHSPSLFLVDIMLPGMSGIELAQQLRAAGYTETPMLALSASPVMVSLAEQSGVFQATVTKPFDLDDLLETIEHYLRDNRPR